MIVFIGASGAGKGTQSEMLVDERGYTHISTGQVLRQYASADQLKGMLEGRLLDDDEIIAIVKKALENAPDRNKVIMDGFPRTSAQAEWLLTQLDQGNFKLEAVIDLVASLNVLKQRLMFRGRADDTEQAIAQRFKAHSVMSQPIIKVFEEHGIHVHKIDASKTPDAVHEAVLRCLSPRTVPSVTH